MKNIENEKKILRKAFKSQENDCFKTEDSQILENFLNSDFYKNANSIFVTVSFNDEINTEKIIKQALKDGKSVYIPKTFSKDKKMVPVQIKDYPSGLKRNSYGILEPENIPDSVKRDFDLILVPGLLFSKDGYRLGYGGGYYDRFLKDNPSVTLALYRSNQLVDTLPHEVFDQKVDYLLSKDSILKTNINKI